MINPFLRKAVWLSESQRDLLRSAAISAKENSKSDTMLCESVLNELEKTEKEFSHQTKNALVRKFIDGLKLPKTSLPIYLCYAEVTEIKLYARIDIAAIEDSINWENGKQ